MPSLGVSVVVLREILCQLVIKLYSGSQRIGMLTGPYQLCPTLATMKASPFLRELSLPCVLFLDRVHQQNQSLFSPSESGGNSGLSQVLGAQDLRLLVGGPGLERTAQGNSCRHWAGVTGSPLCSAEVPSHSSFLLYFSVIGRD